MHAPLSTYRCFIEWVKYTWHYGHANSVRSRLERLERDCYREKVKQEQLYHSFTCYKLYRDQEIKSDSHTINEKLRASEAATNSVITMMENLITNFSKPKAKREAKCKKATK